MSTRKTHFPKPKMPTKREARSRLIQLREAREARGPEQIAFDTKPLRMRY